MFNWVITFFLLAAVSIVIGFGGFVGAFVGIAKIFALVFLALFLGSLFYVVVMDFKSGPPRS